MRSFGFEANPNVDAATVNTLATCEWVKRGEPLCLIGDSETGKPHLLIALVTEAAPDPAHHLASELAGGRLRLK